MSLRVIYAGSPSAAERIASGARYADAGRSYCNLVRHFSMTRPKVGFFGFISAFGLLCVLDHSDRFILYILCYLIQIGIIR